MKMKNSIKIQAAFLFAFLFVNSANAQNICTPDCSVNFTFNPAGSLQAIDAMVITFAAGSELNLGASGTINTAVQPVSLDFSAGGVLNLEAGDSISFDTNGFLSLAQGSNLNVDSFRVNNGNLEISSPSEIIITGDFLIDGALSVSAGKVTFQGNIQQNDDLIISSGGASSGIVIAGSGNIVLGTTGSVTIDGSQITGIGTISIDEIASNIGTISLNEVLTTNDVGQLQTQVLEDLSILNGFELSAQDGTMCTVSGEECISESGDIYKLVDGNLVKQEQGAGMSGFSSLLFLLLYASILPLLRFKSS